MARVGTKANIICQVVKEVARVTFEESNAAVRVLTTIIFLALPNCEVNDFWKYGHVYTICVVFNNYFEL